MAKAIDHMRSALDDLYAAKEKSAFGTELMLSSIIEELESLIERTESINDTEQDQE